MATSTVRISPSTHRALRDLAERERISIQTAVERAVENYRRQRFLEAANRQYAALRTDRVVWEQEAAERAAWDQTLGDGSNDDESGSFTGRSMASGSEPDEGS
jgi:hypothetical protein